MQRDPRIAVRLLASCLLGWGEDPPYGAQLLLQSDGDQVLTRATKGWSYGSSFVGEWQDVPPELSKACLVVDVVAVRDGGAGFALSLEGLEGEQSVSPCFGPVNDLSPSLRTYTLGDGALPARSRARVDLAGGPGAEVLLNAYIEGVVP